MLFLHCADVNYQCTERLLLYFFFSPTLSLSPHCKGVIPSLLCTAFAIIDTFPPQTDVNYQCRQPILFRRGRTGPIGAALAGPIFGLIYAFLKKNDAAP